MFFYFFFYLRQYFVLNKFSLVEHNAAIIMYIKNHTGLHDNVNLEHSLIKYHKTKMYRK